MSTRTRSTRAREENHLEENAFESRLDAFDDITDEDIEDFIARNDRVEEKSGFFNLPTVAGLATIAVGTAYLLQDFGIFEAGFEIGSLIGPWLIGVLLILAGFGVMSWRPRRKPQAEARRRATERRAQQRRERAERPAPERERPPVEESATSRTHAARKQFAKSRTNRKLFGVAGGIGEYFGIDPTIVRIAFVIALIASSGVSIPIYLLLAFIMPDSDDVDKVARTSSRPKKGLEDDDTVIIIR